MATNPVPIKINLQQKTKLLHIIFDDQTECKLSCEFLRVYSPSAEVVGHGPGQETLQLDKENVKIDRITPTGNYAIILFFSDGHDSGIYSWSHLHKLAINQESLWETYLKRLKDAGHSHTQL